MEYIQKKISNTENVRNIFLRFFLIQKMSGIFFLRFFFNTENVQKFQKFLIQKMSEKFLDKFQIYSIKMKLT